MRIRPKIWPQYQSQNHEWITIIKQLYLALFEVNYCILKQSEEFAVDAPNNLSGTLFVLVKFVLINIDNHQISFIVVRNLGFVSLVKAR